MLVPKIAEKLATLLIFFVAHLHRKIKIIIMIMIISVTNGLKMFFRFDEGTLR